MNYLTPHSEKWFEVLRRASPEQAGHTEQIILLAGKTEVCSVCGDTPASDYEVAGVFFQKDTPATIRLCADCRDMRARLQGEKVIPITTNLAGN
jgi:hypothetical protein